MIKPYEFLNIITFFLLVFSIKKSKEILHFAYFLLFVVVSETFIGRYLREFHTSNIGFYNWYAFLCLLFYQYYALSQIKADRYISRWYTLALLYNSFFFIYQLFFLGEHEISNKLYTGGLLLTCIFIIRYFYLALTKEEIGNLFRVPFLWFGLGVLFFATSSFPEMILFDQVIKNKEFVKPLYDLVQMGNFILSFGYLMTAIWMIKTA